MPHSTTHEDNNNHAHIISANPPPPPKRAATRERETSPQRFVKSDKTHTHVIYTLTRNKIPPRADKTGLGCAELIFSEEPEAPAKTCVTIDEWIDVWGALVGKAKKLDDFPMWIQYYPKVLFDVINRTGERELEVVIDGGIEGRGEDIVTRDTFTTLLRALLLSSYSPLYDSCNVQVISITHTRKEIHK